MSKKPTAHVTRVLMVPLTAGPKGPIGGSDRRQGPELDTVNLGEHCGQRSFFSLASQHPGEQHTELLVRGSHPPSHPFLGRLSWEHTGELSYPVSQVNSAQSRCSVAQDLRSAGSELLGMAPAPARMPTVAGRTVLLPVPSCTVSTGHFLPSTRRPKPRSEGHGTTVQAFPLPLAGVRL